MRFVRTRLRDRNEDGAVFVLTALSLVVLLVFAAFAIDLANIWVERRQDQNAADVAALSGAQFTAGAGPTAAAAAAEAEVRRITAQNLGVADAEWDDCVDPARPAQFTVFGPGTRCVSFTSDFTIMRVRIPDQTLDTIFAGVIGIDTLTTSAFAHVEVVDDLAGNVLPFGLPPAAAGDAEVCLKDTGQASGGSTIPADPCDGPQQGNFGYLDFKRFQETGNNRCNTGWVAENISDGVDHFLEKKTTTPGHALHEFSATADDPDGACSDTNARPDRTDEQTGSAASKLHDGLVALAGGGYFGRLTDSPYPRTPVMGRNLDNKPLWEFMPMGPILGAPLTCNRAAIAGAAVPHEAMKTCLQDYLDNPIYTGDLFTEKNGDEYDLLESPRWAYVPVLEDNFEDVGGNGPFIFVDFQPVFIQTLYGNCNNNSCNEFNPGEGNTIANNKKAQAMTAFQIPKRALHDEVNAREPGTEKSIDYVLVR